MNEDDNYNLAVSEETNGFDAYVSHPQFGYELARGRFVLVPAGLKFFSDAAPFILPFDQALVKLGKDENWISLIDRRQPDLEFFVTHDILQDDHFVQAPPIRQQLQRILGRRDMWHRLRVTVIALASFVLLAWLASFAMGWGVRMIVRGIPTSEEIAFGDDEFNKGKAELPLISDTNALAQLQAIAAPLLPAVPARGMPFQFYIMAGPPNAFALPGGRIVVTSGLLDLMDTPDQLVGVLAHESAHVAQRHQFQQVIAGRGPVFLLQMIFGDRNKMFNLLAIPSTLADRSFSQHYEREADSYGFDYLVAAHINPHGLIEALEKLKEYDGIEAGPARGAAFRSHPDMVQRIQWLEAKYAALPDKTNFITLTNPMPKVQISSAEEKGLFP